MSDTVFSSKIDEDVKARFEAGAQAAGISQKEFFCRLVTAHETAQARETVSQVKEIEQLRHHLARIEEIYVGLVKESQDRQEADASKIRLSEDEALHAKAQVAELTEKLDSVIEQNRIEMDSVRAEAALVRETALKDVQDMKDALTRAQEAQQQSAKLALLAEEAATAAKEKAANLETIAGQSEQYRQAAEQAKRDLIALTEQLAKAEAELDAQATRTDEALQRAAERAEIDKDKAVLATQRESMTEISTLREALAKVREDNAELKVQMARGQKPDTGKR